MSDESQQPEAVETPDQIKTRLNAEAAKHRQAHAEAKRELDAVKAKLLEREAAEAEAERKRLEEQGHWQEVANKSRAEAEAVRAERDALKPLAEAHRAAQAAQVEVLKAGLTPAVLEKLALDSQPVAVQLQLLNATHAVQSQLKAATVPTVPTPGTVPTAGAARPAPLTKEDFAAAMMKVANSGLPPAEMRAAMEKLRAAQG